MSEAEMELDRLRAELAIWRASISAPSPHVVQVWWCNRCAMRVDQQHACPGDLPPITDILDGIACCPLAEETEGGEHDYDCPNRPIEDTFGL